MDLSKLTLEFVGALVAVPLLMGVVLGLGRWVRRRFGIPLNLRFKVSAVALSAYVPLRIYQWLMQARMAVAAKAVGGVVRVEGAPQPAAPVLVWDWLLQGLLAVAILFGAFLAVGIVRRYFWDGWFERTQETKAPRFVSDLGAVLIVGVAVLVVARGVLEWDLSGLQLGSTVSVAVLGFASQDLLGNLLSGIALQVASPFKPGDWLLLDGRRLQVVEVNWRATRMRSPDNILVEVPNKTVAGGMITNLSAPTRERATSFVIGLDPSSDPGEVKRRLKEAALQASGVLLDPSPKVLIKDFGEGVIHYEVSFWVAAEEQLTEVSDAVKTGVWQEAVNRGFRLAKPPPVIYVEKASA
jgi:small-conductance mechanosensitive channel